MKKVPDLGERKDTQPSTVANANRKSASGGNTLLGRFESGENGQAYDWLSAGDSLNATDGVFMLPTGGDGNVSVR